MREICMKYGVKVAELSTGRTMHISGKWANADVMAEELLKDGFVVLNYWKEN